MNQSKRKHPESRIRTRIIKRRVWRGVVRVDENDYGDVRLNDFEGWHVDVGFDSKRPDCVWILLDDGRGLMASRVIKRGYKVL